MKKIAFIILAFATGVTLFAQGSSSGVVTKNGTNIIPEQGEIAVGMNAAPFLAYAGGFFSLAGGGAPAVNFAQNIANTNAFYVKYLLSENAAVRVHFNYAHGNNTSLFEVDASALAFDPMNPKYATDKVITTTNNFLLGLGYEMRRGKSRVQGYYGAEVLIGKNSNLTEYQYGNLIDGHFSAPVIHAPMAYDGYGRRITSIKNSDAFLIGIRPYIGVEYFIAAKVSLGGEFGYSIVASKNINQTTVKEYWDGASNSVQTVVEKTSIGGFKNRNMGADNLFGAINLFFYF